MNTTPPRASPLTTPVLETVAEVWFDELQETGRARSRFSPSNVLAVACAVLPTERMAVDIETDTLFTAAGSTTTADDALLPAFTFDVADIAAVPSATPITSPEPETEATPGALDCHVTSWETPAVPWTLAVRVAVSST
jgi:hypothetical protein